MESGKRDDHLRRGPGEYRAAKPNTSTGLIINSTGANDKRNEFGHLDK